MTSAAALLAVVEHDWIPFTPGMYDSGGGAVASSGSQCRFWKLGTFCAVDYQITSTGATGCLIDLPFTAAERQLVIGSGGWFNGGAFSPIGMTADLGKVVAVSMSFGFLTATAGQQFRATVAYRTAT